MAHIKLWIYNNHYKDPYYGETVYPNKSSERATRPPGPPADTNGVSGFGGASPTPMPPPEETNAILAWIQESRSIGLKNRGFTRSCSCAVL